MIHSLGTLRSTSLQVFHHRTNVSCHRMPTSQCHLYHHRSCLRVLAKPLRLLFYTCKENCGLPAHHRARQRDMINQHVYIISLHIITQTHKLFRFQLFRFHENYASCIMTFLTHTSGYKVEQIYLNLSTHLCFVMRSGTVSSM